MNNIDFTEVFIEKLNRTKQEIETLKYYNREKSLLRNYPYANIDIEIKPNNSGLFVIRLMQFEFFEYKLLENYWSRVLIHKDAKFILTSRRIYVYPKYSEDVDSCLNILNFTTDTIIKTINQIKIFLTQSDNSLGSH